jgi:2-polyprenyl-6-methoxyphenol hydroxylase-like FAD-dependent oxidoreductase
MSTIADSVVILGASMAGLATAAALRREFQQVIVVERDVLPTIGTQRQGVSQGRHGHALLPAGLDGLSTLLPDLLDDLRAAGAEICDRPDDIRLHIRGGMVRTDLLDRVTVSASRPLIEGIVRERVRELPNVTFLEGHDVRGLVATPDGRRVTGVRVRDRSGTDEVVVPADLIVDATGRGSRTPRWLEEFGYAAPDVDEVHVDVRYTTRLFRRRPGSTDAFRQVLVAGSPTELRRAYLQAIDGDRWLVTLIGYLGDTPPTDLAAFVDWAATLATPEVHDIVAASEPLGDAVSATYKASVRRRYDRLRRFPDGLVVIGDAICSFNPTYGQGMSVATQEAMALADLVRRQGTQGIALAFFRKARRLIDVPWDLSVGGDLTIAGVRGPRTLRWRAVSAWVARVFRASHRDPVVGHTLLEVMGLVTPPERLMAPAMVRRVLAAQRGPAARPLQDVARGTAVRRTLSGS